MKQINRNLREVAKIAGVSLSTASRVFSNSANVSEDLRIRVLTASAQIGYQPRELVRSQNGTLALNRVVLYIRTQMHQGLPGILGSFYGYVLQGIERECRNRGLTMLFAHNDGSGLSAADIERFNLDDGTGMLLMGLFTPDDIALVQQYVRPVVLLNNVIDMPVDTIVPDYYGGARLAIRHLAAAGHRQIAYLNGRERYTTRQRLAGYLDALREASIPHDPKLITECSMSAHSGHDAVQQLLQRDVAFTALFCVNDVSAVGALTALSEAGCRPGHDMSVVGFDDVDVSDITRFKLTTVQAPKAYMGTLAVRRLQERLVDPDSPAQHITLGVKLIERETVHRL
ncbi:MAG: LacI family transcriptional regulator [Chloroflexales bacterium]|nr:LacI family transcriptional regulator [Chloroflexales bacterium]